jgi:electron transfer flavoprotein beta subunit
MELIVCAKQVPDPEAPPASFKVDAATNKVVPPPGVAPVVSTFDETAVEAALKVKDAKAGSKVTVVSLGNNLVRDVIKKIGKFDIIFCGRQAADWDAGQVGLGIAEILGLPCVTLAKKVTVHDSKVEVERVVADGFEVVEVPLPCLITVTNELGEPRYAPLKGIMKAAKIQPTIWKPADVGLDPAKIGAKGRRAKLVKLFQPVKEGKCEIVEGENVADAAAKLAVRLREAKVL